VAAAGDIAAMESFYWILQMNVLDRRPWSSCSELRYAVVTWIEEGESLAAYPVAFELAFARDASLAA
jgi:hypothetical protein